LLIVSVEIISNRDYQSSTPCRFAAYTVNLDSNRYGAGPANSLICIYKYLRFRRLLALPFTSCHVGSIWQVCQPFCYCDMFFLCSYMMVMLHLLQDKHINALPRLDCMQ
jgi:hypothetical protein